MGGGGERERKGEREEKKGKKKPFNVAIHNCEGKIEKAAIRTKRAAIQYIRDPTTIMPINIPLQRSRDQWNQHDSCKPLSTGF